jgi:hypothetical protein
MTIFSTPPPGGVHGSADDIGSFSNVSTSPPGLPMMPEKPIMGTVFETPRGWVAVTGGKPLLDWSALETVLSEADFKTEPLKIGDDIGEFAKELKLKLEQNGMDTIAYVPDPFFPDRMAYILEDYPKFQADKNICGQTDLVYPKWDSYDRANNKNAVQCLLNSLYKSLHLRVTSRLRDTDVQFTTVWMKVVSEFVTYTPHRWEAICNRIKLRHPKQFPGEDIGLLCDAFDKDAKELTVAGQYDHHLTRSMLESFQGHIGRRFLPARAASHVSEHQEGSG